MADVVADGTLLVGAELDAGSMAAFAGKAQAAIAAATKGVADQIKSMSSGWDDFRARAGAAMADAGTAMQVWGAKTQDTGRQIEAVGSKLTNSITKPILTATAVAGGLVAALGFSRLVGLDTARAQFKGLGYEVEAVMAQVDAGVQGTALSMAQGASLAVGALATGNLPLKDLESQLRRVANVSAAYGVEAEHAGYLLNNVLTKNKVTWGDLSQMQQNQIPIVSQLAQMYGVTGDEIMKMAQDGKISIEDMNRALDEGSGEAAAAYAESWRGIMANIRANVGRIGANILGPAFERWKKMFAGFLAILKSDEVIAWSKRVGESLGAITDRIASFITAAAKWWSGLSDGQQKFIIGAGAALVALGPFLVIVGKVVTAVGGLSALIGKGLSFFAPLVAGTGGAATALARFLGPVGLVITALVTMWTTSEDFRDAITKLGGVLLDAGGKIMTALAPALESIGELIGKIATAIAPLITIAADLIAKLLEILPIAEILDVVVIAVDFLATTLDGLLTTATAVVDTIVALFSGDFAAIPEIWATWGEDWDAMWVDFGSTTEKKLLEIDEKFQSWGKDMQQTGIEVGQWLADDWDATWARFGENASTAWADLGADWEATWARFGENASTWWASISEGWMTWWQGLIGWWEGVLQGLSAWWGETWAGFRANAEAEWANISAGWQGWWGGIAGWWEGALTGLSATWQVTWSTISTWVAAVWGAITTTVSTGINAARSVVTGVLASIRATWDGAWSAVRTAVERIWPGITSAIKVGVNAAYSAVVGIKDRIVGFFAGAGSWLLSAGYSIVDGLAQGIRNAIGGAVSAISGAMSAVRQFLPFSPAKRGPFSGRGWTLFSGRALAVGFGDGILDGMRAQEPRIASALESISMDMRTPEVRLADRADARMLAGAPGETRTIVEAPITIVGDDPYYAAAVVADRIAEEVAL